jgi:HSP20 family protein
MATQVQKTNSPSPRRSLGSRAPLAPRRAYTPQGWEPFHEMERLNDQFVQLIESVWPQEGPGANGGSWIPIADVEETDDAWIVEAEVPSVKRDDINVELRDSELVITGEIKEKERKGVVRRRTRRTGEFEYRLTLPSAADPDKVEAKLHDGVLSVRVPKASRDRSKRIEVKA